MRAIRKSERGRIIVVQEDRFRLVDDSGKGHLFTLSHKARTGAEDLKRWSDSRVTVLVRYTGGSNLSDGIAREVKPLRRQ